MIRFGPSGGRVKVELQQELELSENKIVQGGGLTSLVQQLTDAFLHGVDGLKGVTTAAAVAHDSDDRDETRPMIRMGDGCEVEDYCRWTD